MSIGCSIYFTPVDRSWIGTPDFVRGAAALFEVATFESLRVWQAVPDPAGNSWNDQRLLMELQNCTVEEAVAKMRANHEYTSVMDLAGADTGLLTMMADAVVAALPEAISEGFAPFTVSIHLGQWEVYDQGGDFRDAGLCCVELGNYLGYPIRTQEYLQHFLAVPAVAHFQKQLENLSAQPWEALIELT